MEPTFLEFKREVNIKITIPHGANEGWWWGHGPKFDWCRANCEGEWNGAMYTRSQTEWSFESERDAVLFGLRWS